MEYILANETSVLPDIHRLAPFKAVIAIEEPLSMERQREICQWLLDSGCKYAMVCGESCESWEAMIREINLEAVDLDTMTPEQFVMITTHAREGLRAVYWHAKKHAHHSHVKMDQVITLHIGSKNRSTDYLGIFQKA